MSITAIHIGTLKASNGVPVTITRGNQFCNLVAVPAKSDVTVFGQDGSYTEIEVADWLILVTDWTLSDPPTPKKGDEISLSDETKYLVAHPDQTKPCFRNFNQLDRPAVAWRIHSVPR